MLLRSFACTMGWNNILGPSTCCTLVSTIWNHLSSMLIWVPHLFWPLLVCWRKWEDVLGKDLVGQWIVGDCEDIFFLTKKSQLFVKWNMFVWQKLFAKWNMFVWQLSNGICSIDHLAKVETPEPSPKRIKTRAASAILNWWRVILPFLTRSNWACQKILYVCR